MANYTFASVTTAVVGFASTNVSYKKITFAKSNSYKASYLGIGTNLILDLDSMNPRSYSGISSVTTWYDLTYPDNNASLVGSYSFDGRSIVFADSGYAILTDNEDFTFAGDFAIEVSFNMTGTPNITFPSALVSSWAEFGNSNNKLILYVDSSSQFVLQINGEGNTFVHPTAISLNTNYHTVVTRRSGIIRWYLNGKLGSEINYAAAIEPVLGYRIGSYDASAGQSFEGTIDLVRFYRDRGLGEVEVQNLYHSSINRSVITETNGTRSFDLSGLNIVGAYPAVEPNRPVVGQLYPRFTK